MIRQLSMFSVVVALVVSSASGVVATRSPERLALQRSAQPADLVLRNGKIVTVDQSRPEAQAIAVIGDTIASG